MSLYVYEHLTSSEDGCSDSRKSPIKVCRRCLFKRASKYRNPHLPACPRLPVLTIDQLLIYP
ncbi:hypothetical protein CGMCC3_g11074 [Colletotrichum fructicola]|nr:uncharacterized protein CGMCC3_g11074 [Colletotrichum fructicola]KAE9572826.1 hypothetical protein CGMCC3_g11074 [Colletotrichum fructicola]